MSSREPVTAPRGMNDVMPPESAKWVFFERRCRELFERHGYGEIRTPVVESTALFARGIGEATDIVEKEMYTFADRKGRSLTMRPEMTASCARAYVEHSVHKREPVTRWYYAGPMFRYERMQTGRYRQFYQIGVEAYGIAEPTIDVEQIAMLHRLYADLGVPGLDVVINSVGGDADRPAYRAALVAYLEPRAASLCEDCRRRIGTNPLRVLDCKVEADRAVVAGAPSILDHLGADSRAHFHGVRRGLERLAVPFRVEPRLVRGLDYYTGTVFEILSSAGELGAQSTIVAGGRYDGLVASLGGPATPAFGFALGVERAMLSIPGDAGGYAPRPDLFIAAIGDAAREQALVIAHRLRGAGLHIDVEHRAIGVKAQMKRADKLGARLVAVLGDQELATGSVVLRDMAARDERAVAIDAIEAALRAARAPAALD
jgi:histidyl-tRNA synthetase